MKLQLASILFISFLALGCTDDKSTQREKTYKELEFFVERVESEILYQDDHNWPKIGQHYKKLESKAEDAWRKTKGDERKVLDELEIRYETIEANQKLKRKKLRDKARLHMNNLEIWYRLKSSDEDDILKQQLAEAGAHRSIQWFKANYSRLEFQTKRRYDKYIVKWEFDF